MIEAFEQQMNKVLVLKDLGNLKYYLGIQFERDKDGICLLNQQKYIDNKLHGIQFDQ